MTSDIGRTGEIRLSEGRSSFTLTFAAADFVSWKQNRFAYTLEGFSDGWTYVMDPSRAATYSNLPPGKYRFAVKAANKDGIWNETPTTLDVVIMPHWYNTVWARILLAAVTVAAVFAVAEVGKRLDDTGFSTEQFAEAMNMSRANLHIKMKALTGAPATDFIRKIRLSKACELLKTGRYSVADISAMTGFSSPSYFATSFKKHIGCMPSEYK